MKKILFVMNTMGRAGAEKALLELLNILTGLSMRFPCLFLPDRES